MARIFDKLIHEMEDQNLLFSEPRSFKRYQEEQGGKPGDTARFISVQTIDQLAPELREKGYMIFRLGSRDKDKTTHFALAKLQVSSDWSEYFLVDSEIFVNIEPELFLPNVSIRQLFAFDLLSTLTENSLINLAISSGLLASALDIETSESLAAPASGQGIFTFGFRPSSNAATVWQHENGNVEIDALFVGKRENRETLFVIEAKTSSKFGSLAKYKLVYPILALEPKVPKMIPMVPIYLRAIKHPKKHQIDFYIAECCSFGRSGEKVAVNSLEVVRKRHFVLMGFRTDITD